MLRSLRHRALWSVVLLCVAWLAAGVTLAQDPRASAAQTAARDWLALVDRSDPQASWNAAGKKFQSALPPAAWAEAVKKARTPLGAVKSRTIFKTDFRKKFQDYAEGEYALLVYATSFANKPVTQESLTLEREPDGKWRVVGYFIR